MSKKQNQFIKFIPFFVTIIIVVITVVFFIKKAEKQRRLDLYRRMQSENIQETNPRENVELPEEMEPLQPVLDTEIMSAANRKMPGKIAATVLLYRNNKAANVTVAGSWDSWAEKIALKQEEKGLWQWDTRDLKLKQGFYEFKFIAGKEYESGANRTMYVNENGCIERPLDFIISAKINADNRVDVLLDHSVENNSNLVFRFNPELKIKEIKWISGNLDKRRVGYQINGDKITFCMDESVYGISISQNSSVVVAGTFNNWQRSNNWALHDENNDNVWEGTFDLSKVMATDSEPQFKFIVGESSWLSVPDNAPNAIDDGRGHINFSIKKNLTEKPFVQIFTESPIDLTQSYTLLVDNVALRSAIASVMPGDVLDEFKTDKQLGVIYSKRYNSTLFRIFSPRAKSVDLCLYNTPEFSDGGNLLPAEKIIPMKKVAAQGFWSVRIKGTPYGKYYSFKVDGPSGRGEGFNPMTRVGDPYARAAAYSMNNTILIDENKNTKWFSGWTDTNFQPIAWEDAVIYETHVRDLTIDESSGVPDEVRGKFSGIIASEGRGTGIDHLRDLGVNMIEFMPIAEFYNATNQAGWGYNTSYFFAPESSYGTEPLKGSQYYEFKNLVNYLHNQGFGVILDVVYNHVGTPNVFSMLDRFYFFRIGDNFVPLNFSGCGNDVRTEAPMMRRFIVENILYWMREFHIDGFRFDLAELIDMETMMAIRNAARKENPDVLLISEPWSFRGDQKMLLRGKEWACWNNDFRDQVRYFVLGHGSREQVQKVIQGTVSTWAANPMQSINYLESHDDMCFADEITSNPNHDGSKLIEGDAIRNRMAATILFTSLGIPMLGEGQEYIRSKKGIKNTYNKGDAINALHWDDMKRPIAAETMAYYKWLIKLRTGKAGVPLRLRDVAPEGYYEWLLPDNKKALGYFINKNKQVKGLSFLVLLNPSDERATFHVDFTSGLWRMIANEKESKFSGIKDINVAKFGGSKGSKVALPPLSYCIFIHK